MTSKTLSGRDFRQLVAPALAGGNIGHIDIQRYRFEMDRRPSGEDPHAWFDEAEKDDQTNTCSNTGTTRRI